jgi:hypothetical protein
LRDLTEELPVARILKTISLQTLTSLRVVAYVVLSQRDFFTLKSSSEAQTHTVVLEKIRLTRNIFLIVFIDYSLIIEKDCSGIW